MYDQNKREEQRKKALDAERERKIQELTREAEVAAEAERRENLAKENAVKAMELADSLKYGMGASGTKKKRDADAMEDDSDDDGVVAGAEVGGGDNDDNWGGR